MSKKLNPRQLKFALHFASLGDATRAAKLAGYSEKRAAVTGCELSKKPEVLACVDAELETIRKAQLRMIVRHTETAINRLLREVTEGKSGSMAAVQAANSILDRAGIPVQSRQEISGPSGKPVVQVGVLVVPSQISDVNAWIERYKPKEIESMPELDGE